jgi:hypothetical protein
LTQVLSHLIPLAYALPVYVAGWLTGFGGFYNVAFISARAEDLGWSGLPAALTVVVALITWQRRGGVS